MNFCSKCGSPVILRIPTGDTHLRHVCGECGEIHYLNPKLVVGTLPEWQDKVLLCRRAIEPCCGLWTLPAGFMELGETTAEAALRETAEEACARVEIVQLLTLVNIPHISQVHMLYRARLLDLDFGPGEESLEVALFGEDEIPWNEIAFRSVALTLRHYFADRRTNSHRFRIEDLAPPPER